MTIRFAAPVPVWLLCFLLVPSGTTATADTPGEAGVDVLFLMKDCAAAGKTLFEDCAEDIDTLEFMLWNQRNPTAEAPIIVDIGVGTFLGPLDCNNNGHVTFRGVGRDRTIIDDKDSGSGFRIAININNCDKLEFQDLTVIADTPGAISIAVWWQGGGSSTWTDVDLRANYATWDESSTVECGTPVHYFFGSRLISSGSYGYRALCGEHWFYGSEVRMEAQNIGGINPPRHGVEAGKEADIRLFGSTVRSFPGPGFTKSTDYIGVGVGLDPDDGGEFHMHGGIISVSAVSSEDEAVGIDAVGIDAVGSGSVVHTVDTAFALTKGTGKAIRVRGPGDVRSPLLWESGPTPPAGGGLVSKTGKDLFVETDCQESGCSGGDQPHLMIYSDACSTDPWFDVVRGECRQ